MSGRCTCSSEQLNLVGCDCAVGRALWDRDAQRAAYRLKHPDPEHEHRQRLAREGRDV